MFGLIQSIFAGEPAAQLSLRARLLQEWPQRPRYERIAGSGSKVILKGSVQSWAQYEDLQRHAWSAPGISDVENQLTDDRSRAPEE